MLPEPLHPAVVHFPLVFALVLPILAAVALWRMHDGAPLRTWGTVTLLAALTWGTGYVASRLGAADEERAEEVLASHDPIHEHEEAAEMFLLVSGITAGLAIVGFAPRLIGRSARLLALLGSLVAAAAVARTGFLGGELVFQHGAAAAYKVEGTGAAGAAEAAGVAGAAEAAEAADAADPRPSR